MITLAWYLLKVIICSGVLFGYYYFALRNKIFHHWNRFYLLASIVISLTAPIIKINIWQQSGEDNGTAIRMLQAINTSDEIVIEYSRSGGFKIESANVAEAVYCLVSVSLFAVLFISLYKISRLRKNYPETKMREISFISTDARGTPFSFFNSIFWNNAIDLHSPQGQKIFNHEIAHIKEKHSYDKLFMNIVLIFFWANPFFLLMRKELNMIHEFIADQKAVEDNDISAFADIILHTIYPGQNFSLTNTFFYSPLKRRILMLTQNKNPKVSYLGRLLALPLASIIFFAFTLKMKTTHSSASYGGKQITVVIDAGHGGSDNGAMEDNISEKSLTLPIALYIKQLSTNPNLNIVLSRSGDVDMPVKDRTKLTNEKNADLFISLHMDREDNKNKHSGVMIFIPKDDNPYVNSSKTLGTAILQSFKGNYALPVSDDLRQLERGVWVLTANNCPSVLIEAGYLSTKKDVDFLMDAKNQKNIAQNILNGIEKYASDINENALNAGEIKSLPNATLNDTIPEMFYKNKKVTGLKVVPSKNKVVATYADGTTEMITKEEAKKRGFILPPPPPPVPAIAPVPPAPPTPAVAPVPPPPPPPPPLPDNALSLIDGKISSVAQVKLIAPENIQSVNVLKGSDAIAIYGEKGKNGVIKIIRKNKSGSGVVIFQNATIKNEKGTSIITFKEGAEVQANPLFILNGKEISKEEMNNIPSASIESINVLKNESAVTKYGVKGKNGVVEINTKSNYDLKTDTIPDKVFTRTEHPAAFPGGPGALLKYITTEFDKYGTELLANKNNIGTCNIKFMVLADGSVNNVKSLNMAGTRLEEVAINLIKQSPNWIPARQNGHLVNSYVTQPITFKPNDRIVDNREPK